jgi:hypothetical protein
VCMGGTAVLHYVGHRSPPHPISPEVPPEPPGCVQRSREVRGYQTVQRGPGVSDGPERSGGIRRSREVREYQTVQRGPGYQTVQRGPGLSDGPERSGDIRRGRAVWVLSPQTENSTPLRRVRVISRRRRRRPVNGLNQRKEGGPPNTAFIPSQRTRRSHVGFSFFRRSISWEMKQTPTDRQQTDTLVNTLF